MILSPERKSTERSSTEIRGGLLIASFTAGIGASAALDLDGGVVEPEALLEPRLDALHDEVRILDLADTGMQRHHAPALRDRPDMHMVDFLDAFDIGDEIGANRPRIELSGGAFEQDVCRNRPPPASRS